MTEDVPELPSGERAAVEPTGGSFGVNSGSEPARRYDVDRTRGTSGKVLRGWRAVTAPTRKQEATKSVRCVSCRRVRDVRDLGWASTPRRMTPRDEGEHQSRHSEWVERSGCPSNCCAGVGGRWAPGPLVPGAVARCVADVAADWILASIGGGEPRMEFGESPTPRARALLDRLEASRERPDAVLARVAAGQLVGGDRDDARVLDVVVERADAIVDFILDPTRAWRSDRVRDVEHSRAANPWPAVRLPALR